MKRSGPNLEELMKTEEFQQQAAKIKARLDILDWINQVERCMVPMELAMAALKAGDHRAWRRWMKRICELSVIDPAQFGL